jgi:hypothetical protein
MIKLINEYRIYAGKNCKVLAKSKEEAESIAGEKMVLIAILPGMSLVKDESENDIKRKSSSVKTWFGSKSKVWDKIAINIKELTTPKN